MERTTTNPSIEAKVGVAVLGRCVSATIMVVAPATGVGL